MLCFVDLKISILYIKKYLKNIMIQNIMIQNIMIFLITLIEIGNQKELIKKLNIFENGIISIY